MLVAFLLIPLTMGLSFLGLWLIFLFWIISRIMVSKRIYQQSTLSEAIEIARTYDSPAESSDIFMEEQQDQYMFPTRCPYCKEEVHLGNIEWIGSDRAICPNCESVISASKV